MKGQSIRFLLVGILNTVVGYSVYYICLVLLDFNYVGSLTIAHIIGVVHSYIWNNKWTFKVTSIDIKSIYRFCSVYLISFLVNLIILSLLVQLGGVNKLISQAVALFITTLISYFGHKYWSFNKNFRLEKE
jgi:putative flippase GtrA